MKRQIFTIREMNKGEADLVNRSFQELYQHKIEEVAHTTSLTQSTMESFRSAETGVKVVNVTSSLMTVTIPYQSKYSNILSINIDPVGTAFSTIIQSFTASEMVIKINSTSTSVNAKFFYKITGNGE